ncbi:sterol desaturase family protein [Janthinobacterium lividum]|uniref:sterol desaturase family protein n=1 Tax=Janthinobacterium lividum TaxID=29581 RepID=UPI00087556BF|nr:sterol desaturase family protein [Janthinobacterium lividum]MCC7714453.1 sterol desaturase family protein [Janthinobacterium lividum]OEZ55342.1 fatty acid hydroxylase superfamily protein [Janthinobacterium lividum]WQE30344.1 sterol desaturase family protein [Janthinobacterium lividum]STQ95840.1 Fatty acid hydroxylase superfamily [Janthinobacterium lividum]
MSLLHTLQTHLPGIAIDVLRLVLWLVLLAVIFVPLERFFGERHAGRSRTELFSDLGFYFISSLLPAALLAAPLALLAVAGQRLLPDTIPAALSALPLWGKILLGLLIGEVGTYWGHRLSHEIPWLWRYHAVHHSMEQLYFLANTRTHPVDMVVTRLFGLTPLYLLGLAGPSAAGSAAPVLLLLIGTVWGFFIHANLRWRFGPLEWLVATPAFHHWHHSKFEHINRNYASTLPVLDRLFGTYHLPRAWPAACGIEAAMPQTLAGQLAAPFRRTGKPEVQAAE